MIFPEVSSFGPWLSFSNSNNGGDTGYTGIAYNNVLNKNERAGGLSLVALPEKVKRVLFTRQTRRFSHLSTSTKDDIKVPYHKSFLNVTGCLFTITVRPVPAFFFSNLPSVISFQGIENSCGLLLRLLPFTSTHDWRWLDACGCNRLAVYVLSERESRDYEQTSV
ncbi:hypothetical protein RRG08_009980 [Elysia crispata]|uniref:Uncharacterized protein n=1 Tax=Elysia crispata TaxID=231223 RepID=A0AAE1B6A5_9GAST|nr:hypothetical protein RRG08_009980 [Elysia crispata]